MPSIEQDLPCALDAIAPPRVIKGYPGSWGIHKLFLRVKFRSSAKVIPASTVISFCFKSKFNILLNLFKDI